jgi:hypothetical protein
MKGWEAGRCTESPPTGFTPIFDEVAAADIAAVGGEVAIDFLCDKTTITLTAALIYPRDYIKGYHVADTTI